MGAAAYDTMTQLWNPEAAAERLLTLCRCILAGNPHPKLYSDGPCSPAPILPDGGSHERREACGQRRLDHRRKKFSWLFLRGGKHDRRPGC